MADIRGALVTLRPLTEARISKFHTDLQPEDRWSRIHATNPPDLAALKMRMLQRRSIRAWDMIPEGGTTSIGYAGYRVRCGCPFLFLLFTTRPFDIPIAEDTLPPLIHHFFSYTHPRLPDYRQDDPLMIYLDHAVADAMHGFLVDNGFDPMADFPIIDNSRQSAYGLLRDTYEAYRGEASSNNDESELYPDEPEFND